MCEVTYFIKHCDNNFANPQTILFTHGGILVAALQINLREELRIVYVGFNTLLNHSSFVFIFFSDDIFAGHVVLMSTDIITSILNILIED